MGQALFLGSIYMVLNHFADIVFAQISVNARNEVLALQMIDYCLDIMWVSTEDKHNMYRETLNQI